MTVQQKAGKNRLKLRVRYNTAGLVHCRKATVRVSCAIILFNRTWLFLLPSSETEGVPLDLILHTNARSATRRSDNVSLVLNIDYDICFSSSETGLKPSHGTTSILSG